ncbi:MAG TPA: rhomboid family intramembrane serine protease, partial [Polyangiaceae bacterium]|nr:rhomboid family intramembrane serine protease [Polyangiaceae bacterium]
MRRSDEPTLGGAFPRPGPALTAVLAALLGLWIVLALAINWGPEAVSGIAAQIYALGAGSPDALRQLELWRLVTAAAMHEPQGLGSIFFSLLSLYFLAPSLERSWGSRRFLLFLVGASVASYGLQALALLLLPASLGRRLAPEAWLGSMPLVEAIAIAWATSFRGRVVNLFFVLPVSSRGLVLF